MQPFKPVYLILIHLIAGLTLLLQGCETTPMMPTVEPGQPADLSTAIEAEKKGEYVLAAQQYEQMATSATEPKKSFYQLKSIETLIKAGQFNEAKQKIGRIDDTKLENSLRAHKYILLALIASSEGSYEKAIRILRRAKAAPGLDPSVQSEISRIMAETELALGNPIGAAKNLVLREKYLTNIEDIDHNQLKIWDILSNMPFSKLKQARDITRDPVLRGWLELVTEYAMGQRNFNKLIKNWNKTHPDHPATKTMLATIAGTRPMYIGKIKHIAVLLPLTSEYQRAAEAVQEGIFAMHNNDNKLDKPIIKIYDIGDDPTNVKKFYELAVKEGAQLVIGPLGREAVDELAKNGDLDTPTIFLSHTEEDIEDATSAIFQFGLVPEQEAKQAAERAYLDGHRLATILYPNNNWGHRVGQAFAEHWQRLGGIVLASQVYELNRHDYSEPIKKLLNIAYSEQRKTEIELISGLKLVHEPRRRQDANFIFLAADAKHGRLIKPQLNYHRASRLPVYATSKIFTGRKDRIRDTDMDGIMFGDMPWMLIDDGSIYKLRLRQGNWPYAHTQLDRLYALGMDAYSVIPHLNRISSDASIRFNGVTSGLSVDPNGRLHRQLLWARFKRGIPKLLDTFYKYTGQLGIQDKPDDTKYSSTSAAGTPG